MIRSFYFSHWAVILVPLSAFVIAFSLLFLTRHNHVQTLTQPPMHVYEKIDEPMRGCKAGNGTDPGLREKAAFLSLTREEDLEEFLPTLVNLEAKFNSRFRYPYVILSDPDSPVSSSFKSRIEAALPSKTDIRWGVVPKEHWRIPEWLEEEEVNAALVRQGRFWSGIKYGGRIGYHHMCRFYSGLHARHPILDDFDYYWRTEATAKLFCDIPYDPFRYMAENRKVYGFNMIIKDIAATIPSLWPTVQSYRKTNQIRAGGVMGLMEKRDAWSEGPDYTRCHFWNNFEIVDLRFLRSKAYQAYFDYLDRAGGFYLERWGDAPVRSLGVALFLQTDQIHYFEDIGYQHDLNVNCPRRNKPRAGREGVGCNCGCPEADGKHKYQEEYSWSCEPLWDVVNRRQLHL